jgi:hypothetical protein
MMTTTDPTNTILSISENLERLDAQPRPAITQPCPDWCNTGPHTPMFVDVEGGISFNHDAMLMQGQAEVSISVAETIGIDGTWQRTPLVFYAAIEHGETADPAVVFEFAQALVMGAELFRSYSNQVNPLYKISDKDLLEEIQLRMERAREAAGE